MKLVVLENPEKEIKILGINSDSDTCSNCGKTNLSKCVWLNINGNIAPYGVDCAALLIKGKKSASNNKTIQNEAIIVENARKILNQHSLADSLKYIERQGYYGKVENNKLLFYYQGKRLPAFGEIDL